MYNVQWEHGRSYAQPYYGPVCDPAGPVSVLVMALIQYRPKHYPLPADMLEGGTALLNYCSTGPVYIFVIYQNYFFRQTLSNKHPTALYCCCYFSFFPLPYDNVGKFTNIPWWRFSCWQPINLLRPSDAIWRQITRSTLAQVMACCLTAPSHYLNQCWLIISKVLYHSCEVNFTRDTSAINHQN